MSSSPFSLFESPSRASRYPSAFDLPRPWKPRVLPARRTEWRVLSRAAKSMTGVEHVEYSGKYCHVKLCDYLASIKVPMRDLPAVEHWTVFKLAEAARAIVEA